MDNKNENLYCFNLYDENNNLVYSKTYHNIAMIRRYAAQNMNSLYLVYGGIFSWDIAKFTDGKGNWLPGMAKENDTITEKQGKGKNEKEVTKPNSTAGDTNDKPVPVNDPKYHLEPPVLITDKGLFGTSFVERISLDWQIEEDLSDISKVPDALHFKGTGVWDYHDTWHRLNSYSETGKEPTIISAKNESDSDPTTGKINGNDQDKAVRSIYGFLITDGGLFSDKGMATHVKIGNGLIKRPPQKLEASAHLSFNIPPATQSYNTIGAFWLSNFRPFIPQASALYGHRNGENSSSFLPQYYPEIFCVSSYLPQSIGVYSYPVPVTQGIRINRCFSEKLGGPKKIPAENGKDMITIDKGWTELDYQDEDNGEWHGFPIFYYIGNIDSPNIPNRIELPNERETGLNVDIPEKYLDLTLSTGKVKIAPTFTVSQWLAETRYDNITGKNLAIIYYHWNVQTITKTLDGKVEEKNSKERTTEKDRYKEGTYTGLNNNGEEVTVTYTKADPFSTSIFTLTPVKHLLNDNKYYNWNCLKPIKATSSLFGGYYGPVRSLVFKDFSIKKCEKGKDEECSVSMRIGTGDGSSTVFYHPFIDGGDWHSGKISSVFCDSASCVRHDEYTPQSLFGNTYSVYSYDLSTLYFESEGNGTFTYGSIFKAADNDKTGAIQYPANIGYHKRYRKSHWNLNPFNLEYCPVGEVLGFNGEAIVYNKDLLSEKRLYYWFGQNGGTYHSISYEFIRSSSLDLDNPETEQVSVVLGTPQIITGDLYYDFPSGNGKYNYTIIRVYGLRGTPRQVGSGVTYTFFEPSAIRLSLDGPVGGKVVFDKPPAIGSPIYITAETSIPFFHEKTEIDLKFLYKVGQKSWNGTPGGHKGLDVQNNGDLQGGKDFKHGDEYY